MTGDALDLDKLRALAKGAHRANRLWPADYNTEYSVCDRTESRAVQDYVDALSPQTMFALLDAHAAAVRDRDAAVREVEELRAVVGMVVTVAKRRIAARAEIYGGEIMSGLQSFLAPNVLDRMHRDYLNLKAAITDGADQ